MSKNKVTVAIPTFNRSKYIAESVRSVLNQSFSDFELLIVDNASIDNTHDVISNFEDSRIRYIRNNNNIGMMENWNKCIENALGDYLLILGDDDILQPEFLEHSAVMLDTFPSVGFTFCHCNKVNDRGEIIQLWGYNFPPAGYIKGVDYLMLTIKYGCNLTNSSSVLIRKSVFKTIGLFKQEYGYNTFDFNMWLRIARRFDLYFIDKRLVNYRIHPEQITELHWRTQTNPTGLLGSILEIIGMIAILIEEKVSDIDEYNFLAKRLAELNMISAQSIKKLIAHF